MNAVTAPPHLLRRVLRSLCFCLETPFLMRSDRQRLPLWSGPRAGFQAAFIRQ